MAGLPQFQGVGTARANPVRQPVSAGGAVGSLLGEAAARLEDFALGQMKREAKQVQQQATDAGETAAVAALQGNAPLTLRTDTGTVAGEAFNAGAASAYLAGLQIDMRDTAARLASEHEDPQAFSQAWQSYRQGLLSRVPEPLRADAELELMNRGGLALGAVEQTWATRQRQAQADTLFQSLDGLAEDYRGLMRAGDTQAATRIAEQANLLLDGMVQSGHLSGSQAAAQRAKLQDDGEAQAILSHFDAAVSEGGLDGGLAFIDAYARHGEGDPEFRDRMVAGLRAQWSQRKSIRNAQMVDVTRQVRSAIEVLEAGYPVDLDATAQVAAGTPLAAEVEAARRDQEYVAAYAKQDPASQASVLQDVETKLQAGMAPEAAQRVIGLRDRLARVHANTTKALEADPLGHAARVGVVSLPNLDWQAALSGDANAVREVFQGRVAAADTASAQFGRATPPLTAAEIDGLARVVEDGDARTATQVLGVLRAQLPDEHLARVLERLAPKAPAFVAATGIAADPSIRPREVPAGAEVVPDILRGAEIRRTTEGVTPTPADGYLTHLNTFLGNAFVEDDGARHAVVEAALNLYATRTYAAGAIGQAYDEERLARALKDVTGGIIEYNGEKIIPPARGMDGDDFADLLDAVTDEDLAGALHPTGRVMSADWVRDNATFVNAGAGRYFVNFGDKTVVRVDDPRRRFVLDLTPVLDRKGAR